MEEFVRSRVPWSTMPSLKEKAEEVGIDIDVLIEGLRQDKTDQELAQELGASEKIVKHLREHFMTRGLGSIMGQD